MPRRITTIASRWLHETGGQDLVEYALLTALIGLTAVAAAPLIQNALAAAYSAWTVGNQNLWTPPDPGAGGS